MLLTLSIPSSLQHRTAAAFLATAKRLIMVYFGIAKYLQPSCSPRAFPSKTVIVTFITGCNPLTVVACVGHLNKGEHLHLENECLEGQMYLRLHKGPEFQLKRPNSLFPHKKSNPVSQEPQAEQLQDSSFTHFEAYSKCTFPSHSWGRLHLPTKGLQHFVTSLGWFCIKREGRAMHLLITSN